MTTIADVAKQAKVSTATVSNVFNKPERVKEETRDHVLDIAENLGFVPNLYARNLRGSPSGLIGVIITDIRLPEVSQLTRGIQDQLTQFQRTGVIINTDLYKQGIRAFILSPDPFRYSIDNQKFFRQLQSDGVTLVFIGDELASYSADVILTSAQEGATAMVRHLVNKGHKKIAYVGWHLDNGTAGVKRWLGYQEGLLLSGVPIQPEYFVEVERSMAGGIDGIQRLLISSDPPTAVMGASDTIASGIVHECHRQGVPIPEQLSVVGFHDEPLARHLHPTLTTVRLPFFEIGQRAIDVLLERIDHPELAWQKPRFDYDLILRESVAGL